MNVNNFTVKTSGTVAYTDNSHGSFESTAVWMGSFGGLVAQHSSADSQFHFNQLLADKNAQVNAMLALLPGSISLTPPISTPDRTVESFVMEISGCVTYDDNSEGLFIVQWIDGALSLFPTETAEHWAAIAEPGSESRSLLDLVFEALAGGSGAAINEEDATATATMRPTGVPTAVARGSGYSTGADLPLLGGTFSSQAAVLVNSLSTVIGQDESSYGGGELFGTFVPGTGYTAGDTITLSDGTVVTVDAEGTAGDITAFTITSASTSGSANVATLSQTGTSGSGVGFSLTQSVSNQGVFAASVKSAGEIPIGEYTALPSDPVSTSVVGLGSGATFAVDWAVRAVAVTDGGIGYTSVPAVSFGGAGGVGTTAVAALTGDVVTSVTVGVPGSGYVERATVTIDAPPPA